MSQHDLNKMCLGCMRYIEDVNQPCPFCGSSHIQNQPHQLNAGCFLAGKYLVGRALGEGGFGITYLGWDISQNVKVAIKEYYPVDSVSRQGDFYTVAPRTTQGAEQVFSAGKDKFFSEAQSLARFDAVPGIVRVFDYFQENNTAYIIMEFIEGQTLRDYLNTLGQPLFLNDILALLAPVVDSLGQVHAANLIHRDISPDNIMITEKGITKLLDFGAARLFSLQGERSNTINVKMGYAPEEQYLTHGSQGPWTDVYALAATIYRAITGIVPPQSLDRVHSDTLVKPSALGITINPGQEAALLKGMAVYPKDRYQTVGEFYKDLRDGTSAVGNTAASLISAGEAPLSGSATIGQKLGGMTARFGGWKRLLCMAAALVMLIYALGTLNEGYRDISAEDRYNIYGMEFIELEHKSGQYQLISSAAAAIFFVCAVITVKTKGQKPSPAAAAVAAVVVEITAVLHMNCFNEYFGYGPYMGEMVFYMLPPLLSFLAVYFYWSAQKKSA